LKVSVIIPAYNESATVGRCVAAVYAKNPSLDLEVIVVDDGSTDETAKTARAASRPGFKLLQHTQNRGKGAAIRTGLAVASGDIILIQDADLEYDPADYEKLLAPIRSGKAQVVYGSRIKGHGNKHSYERYYWGGRLLSVWTNLLFGSHITDEPTCYKVFKVDLLKSLNLTCEGFEFCPEVTAKILRQGTPIVEVPIHYYPRSMEEGKKIRWWDGVKALWTLTRLSTSFNIFLIAVAVRLAFLGLWVYKDLGAVYGRDLYYSLAQNWLGWTAPVAMDATHPPFYTLFIAAILRFFGGPNPLPILWVQILLSAAICPLILWLGTRLVSDRIGRLAALWIAFDPALIFFAPQLQTETLFVFMEMIFFVWLYSLLEEKSLTETPSPSGRGGGEGICGWFGLGCLGGLASLCRSVIAAYPVVLLLALWRMKGPRRIGLPFVLLSMGWLSPIICWTARNWLKYHEIIPISAQMGWNLYEGFTADREEIRRRPYEMAQEVTRLGITDPVLMSNYFKNKTFTFIREHPAASARIILTKMCLYWRPWPYDPHPFAIRVLLSIYFSGLFVLAGYGIWIIRAQSALWQPVYALFLYLTAMHSIFFTSLRYRLPLEPFLCLWAAVGLDRILRRSER